MNWRFLAGVLGHGAQAPGAATSKSNSNSKATNKPERPAPADTRQHPTPGEASNVSTSHVNRNISIQGTPFSFMGESRTDNSIMGCSLLSSRSITDHNTFEQPGSTLTMEWHAQRSFHDPHGMSQQSVGVSLHDPYSVHGPPSVTIGSIAASVGGSGVWANSVASINDLPTSAHRLCSKASLSHDTVGPRGLYDPLSSTNASVPKTSLYASQRGGRVGDGSERRSLFDDVHINDFLPAQPFNPSQQTQDGITQNGLTGVESNMHQEAAFMFDKSRHNQAGSAVRPTPHIQLKPTLSGQLKSMMHQSQSQSNQSAHNPNPHVSDNSSHGKFRPRSELCGVMASRSKSAHGGSYGQQPYQDRSNHSHSGHWSRSRQRGSNCCDRSVGHPVRIGAVIAEGNDGEENSSNGRLATRLSSSEPSHHMNSSRGIPEDEDDLHEMYEDIDPTTSRTLEWLRQYLDVLGQGTDSKQIFVARRHLTLPALGLLSSFLSYTPAIRVLTLVHAGLDDAGATELAIGLRQSYGGLWVLDLRNNSIGDQGAAVLASCLTCCPELKDMVLSYNNIGDDGVYSLVDEVAAAGQRQIPVRVRLSHNPASQDAIKALATVCKTTKQRRLRASRSTPSMVRHVEDPLQVCDDLDKSPDLDILLDGTNTSEEDDRSKEAGKDGNAKSGAGSAVVDPREQLRARLFSGDTSMFASGANSSSMSRREQAVRAEREELDRLCELVRVLATPSMPVEHRVAQDVGSAFMKHEMISRQRSNANSASQPLPVLLASNLSKSSHKLNGSTLNIGEDHQGTLSALFIGDDPTSNAVIMPRSEAHNSIGRENDGKGHSTMGFQSIDVLEKEPTSGSHYTIRRGSKDYSGSHMYVDRGLSTSRAVDAELSMLVSALRARGHEAISAVSGGCPNVADCLQNLRHAYLTVFLPLLELGFGPADVEHAQQDDDQSDVACLSTYSYAMTVAIHGQHAQQEAYAARTGRSSSASPGDLGSFGDPNRGVVRDDGDSPNSTTNQGMPTSNTYSQRHQGNATPDGNATANGSSYAGDHTSRGTAVISATAVRVKSHTVHGGCEFYNSGTVVEGNLSDVAGNFAAASSKARHDTHQNGRQPNNGSTQLRSRMSTPHIAHAGDGLATPLGLVTHMIRGNRIIVDPKFRDQFELGKYTTQRYDAIVSMLPRVFVGHEDRLPLLVELLCEEMSSVFKDRGRPVPPWRKASSLISKWKQRGVAASGQLPDSALPIRQ